MTVLHQVFYFFFQVVNCATPGQIDCAYKLPSLKYTSYPLKVILYSICPCAHTVHDPCYFCISLTPSLTLNENWYKPFLYLLEIFFRLIFGHVEKQPVYWPKTSHQILTSKNNHHFWLGNTLNNPYIKDVD